MLLMEVVGMHINISCNIVAGTEYSSGPPKICNVCDMMSEHSCGSVGLLIRADPDVVRKEMSWLYAGVCAYGACDIAHECDGLRLVVTRRVSFVFVV